MSLSSGSPGWILLSTPSRPAMSMAENARYGLAAGSGGRNSTRSGGQSVPGGLAAGSGGRNSTRLALGLAEYMGMRQAAERLRREYAKFTGAAYPGTKRL